MSLRSGDTPPVGGRNRSPVRCVNMLGPMEAAGIVEQERPRISSARVWGFFFLMLGVLVFATLWQGAAPDMPFDVFFGLIGIWSALAVGWVIYMAVRAVLARSLAWITWRDWVLPAVATVTLVLMATSAPFLLRFQLAEPDMTHDARRVLANERLAPRTHRIGPWRAENVEVYGNGLRFAIPDLGFLDPVGFAYYPDGPPSDDPEDNYSRLGDGWWIWEDGW